MYVIEKPVAGTPVAGGEHQRMLCSCYNIFAKLAVNVCLSCVWYPPRSDSYLRTEPQICPQNGYSLIFMYIEMGEV